MKSPYLIQRAKENVGFHTGMKVSEAFNLDYMGSAEFEFGTVPQSIREMQKEIPHLQFESIEVEKNKITKTLFEIKDCDGKVIETRIFRPAVDVSINGYSLVRDLFRVFDPKKVVIHSKSGITITYTKET